MAETAAAERTEQVWQMLAAAQPKSKVKQRERRDMPSHKFSVGELVELKPAVSRNVPGGVYEIVKILPGDGECEYRIKSSNEPHERVARESELRRL